MFKLKTNKSASKRFRKTGNGFKHRSSFRNHLLTKKSSKRKGRLASTKGVSKQDLKSVQRMLINN